MDKQFKITKLACYSTNICMSVVANISPILFITFNKLYNISFRDLGFLIVVFYCTQLGIDLIFSFFSKKFNIPLTVRITPIIAFVGLIFYGLTPFMFPNNIYIGILTGTVIFSAASGLVEVLISPVIAAIPSKNPEREMSKLHSLYAWGVVFFVIFATLFMFAVGSEKWYLLPLVSAIVPLIASLLFFGASFPDMQVHETHDNNTEKAGFKTKGIWVCVFAIFLGGAAECTMSQWSSAYLEAALGIPKIWGDIFGVALFGLTLGLGRTLYARFGKNVEVILFIGSIAATICYLTAALTSLPVLGLIACALTGLATSMLWPGNLIISSKRVPNGGVFLYALMAAGGDFGASVAPQLVGLATDYIGSFEFSKKLALDLGLTTEQLGMKAGMLIAMFFPLILIFVYIYILKLRNKTDKGAKNESNN